MQVLITGATGFIGRVVVKRLQKHGHHITVVSRNLNNAESILGKDAVYLQDLTQLKNLDDYDAVINLAGEPIVDKAWSAKQKQRIIDSRWNITEKLTDLINASANPPRCFISGSAIGIYGSHDHQWLDENAAQNDDFGHQVCLGWEQKALAAQSQQTRVCVIRTGLVLGRGGGLLGKMLLPFKLGLGGRLGSGQQGMSWIHIDDYVDMLLFLMLETEAHGIFNGTAPNPVSNQTFTQCLGKALNRPTVFPVPALVLTLLLGERSSMLLEGQFVIPKAVSELGFAFKYNNLDSALADIIR
ncbi:TIGR01777 family oxidoreductase [Paraferrimonas haliotis]|uniref:Epimerase family protein YfcH n=1 Tax=Paraferrimonas haliotis TaxID=2013866 RepID=A0AA37TP49_9GAMM|nr:TIGR01777 family oxidoreductase [Paraferrimonas haliotis]GLS84223.1 epimerase family protein YfcH [Paraferrimonas haliotis]